MLFWEASLLELCVSNYVNISMIYPTGWHLDGISQVRMLKRASSSRAPLRFGLPQRTMPQRDVSFILGDLDDRDAPAITWTFWSCIHDLIIRKKQGIGNHKKIPWWVELPMLPPHFLSGHISCLIQVTSSTLPLPWAWLICCFGRPIAMRLGIGDFGWPGFQGTSTYFYQLRSERPQVRKWVS